LFTYGVKASQCRRTRSHRNEEAGWLLKESVDRAIWDALGTIATDKQQPPKAHEEEKKKKKSKNKKKDKKLTASRQSGSDATMVSALTHVLAHTLAQDLDAALASRVSVLGLICLVERGLTPMFLSLWLNAVRASGCLNALFAASELPDSNPQEITPLPGHEDCQVIAACLNRSLSDIFRGHTRAVKAKCIVTFLDVLSPALPFLPILRDPVSQLYVQRLLNGLGGVAEAKAGGALGAYLRGPLSLHAHFFRLVLLSTPPDVALDILKRYQAQHGAVALQSMGMTEALLQVVMARGLYRFAYLAALDMNVLDTYPVIERVYREERIKQLVTRGKWQFAVLMLDQLRQRTARKWREGQRCGGREQRRGTSGVKMRTKTERRDGEGGDGSCREAVLERSKDSAGVDRREGTNGEEGAGEAEADPLVRRLGATLVKALLLQPGHLAHAARLRQLYDLEGEIPAPSPSALAEEAAVEQERYLNFPGAVQGRREAGMPAGRRKDEKGADGKRWETGREARSERAQMNVDRIYVVHDLESLQFATSTLSGVRMGAEAAWREGYPEVVGMDVEWRPALYGRYGDEREEAPRQEEAEADRSEERPHHGSEGEGEGVEEQEGGAVDAGERVGAAVAAQTEERQARTSTTTPGVASRDVDFVLGGSRGLGMGRSKRSEKQDERASILQLATRDQAFIFDLWSLAGRSPRAPAESHADGSRGGSTLRAGLDACLGPLFENACVLKLGFGLGGDLDVLRRSWPQVKAFQTLVGALDVGDLRTGSAGVVSTRPGSRAGGRGVGEGQAKGLSAVCRQWLGKDLNKAEQVSDWDARPLSASQVKYAAMDAWVLTAIFDEFCRRGSEQARREWVGRRRTFHGRKKRWMREEKEGERESEGEGQGAGTCVVKAVGGPVSGGGAAEDGMDGGHGDSSHRTSHGSDSPIETYVLEAYSSGHVPHMASTPTFPPIAFFDEDTSDPGILPADFPQALRTKSVALMVTGNLSVSTSQTKASRRTDPAKEMEEDGVVGGERGDGATGGQRPQEVTSTPLLVVAPATAKVNFSRLAAWLGLPRAALRLATADECLSVLAFPPGSIPPVGHRTPARLVLDQSLCPHPPPSFTLAPVDTLSPASPHAMPRLLCGAGAPNKVFICRPEELLGLGGANAVVAPVCSSSSTGSASSPFAPLNPLSGLPSAVCGALTGSTEGKEKGPRLAPGDKETREALTFLVDSMLGRLSKWLRVLGVDVEFHDFHLPSILSHKAATHTSTSIRPAPPGTPPPILLRAHQSKRVVLTRDRRLVESRHNALLGVYTYLVQGNDTRQQLEQVVESFEIQLDVEELMSRCSGCNAKGYVALSKEEIEARQDIPERVKRNVDTFWTCVNEECEKIYWKGEMWNKASSKFGRMIAEMTGRTERLRGPEAFDRMGERGEEEEEEEEEGEEEEEEEEEVEEVEEQCEA
jgi:uncharacterized protein with PIN domain